MYAGRVACCTLVSHTEYAPRTLLRLEKKTDRQTDRCTDGQTADRYTTLTTRRGQRTDSAGEYATSFWENDAGEFPGDVADIFRRHSEHFFASHC